MSEFNAREALERLNKHLEHYAKDEYVEGYDENVFIHDILFFLGKSVDKVEYNWSTGFRKFLADIVYPKALRAHEEHKAHFARKLGLRK